MINSASVHSSVASCRATFRQILDISSPANCKNLSYPFCGGVVCVLPQEGEEHGKMRKCRVFNGEEALDMIVGSCIAVDRLLNSPRYVTFFPWWQSYWLNRWMVSCGLSLITSSGFGGPDDTDWCWTWAVFHSSKFSLYLNSKTFPGLLSS